MTKSVLIAILVSLVVSAICNHVFHWNLPQGEVTANIATILLAVVTGLITLAILATIMKQPPGALVVIVAVAVLSALAIYVAVKLFPPQQPSPQLASIGPVVRCSSDFSGHRKVEFDSGEEDPDRNGLYRGNQMTWHVYAPERTTISWAFQKSVDHDTDCKGESPFAAKIEDLIIKPNTYSDTRTSTFVVANGSDCYHYTITCKFPVGTPLVIDPIIDVPPRRQGRLAH